MATLANSSEAISSDLQKQLTTPGIKQADLIEALEGLTDRQEQVVRNAENIDPPGPLREAHRGAVEALQFRVSGSTASSRPSAGPPTTATRRGLARCSPSRRSGSSRAT